jgi:hypothetical protein
VNSHGQHMASLERFPVGKCGRLGLKKGDALEGVGRAAGCELRLLQVWLI